MVCSSGMSVRNAAPALPGKTSVAPPGTDNFSGSTLPKWVIATATPPDLPAGKTVTANEKPSRVNVALAN